MPQKMVEQRHEKDQEIQFEVAFQMIRAVCAGGIVRRQKHLAKLEAKKRLMRAGKLATGGVNLAAASSRDKVIRNLMISYQSGEPKGDCAENTPS